MNRTTSKLVGLLLMCGVVVAAIFATTAPDAAKDPAPAYAPEQPIAFPHTVHARDDEIPCQFCHIYADRSQSAGVPPTSLCMNCHKVVGSGLPEVEKLKQYWADRQPVEWQKVFDLPDHVYFSHQMHVQAGENLAQIDADKGFTCQTCHGAVEQMEKVYVAEWDPRLDEAPLTMGWCLTCHIEKSGDAALLNKLKREAYAASVEWPTLVGEVEIDEDDVRHTKARLRDCMACHK